MMPRMEASRVLIAPCGLRDQTAESDDAGTPIPQRASGGVGSALMFRARYAAAVIVGFAIGIQQAGCRVECPSRPMGGHRPGEHRPGEGGGADASAPLGQEPTARMEVAAAAELEAQHAGSCRN